MTTRPPRRSPAGLRRAIFRLTTEAALRRERRSAASPASTKSAGAAGPVPVYAAAVVLPASCYRDRSLLAARRSTPSSSPPPGASASRRTSSASPLGAAVAWAEAPVIDRLNILGATRLRDARRPRVPRRRPARSRPAAGARRRAAWRPPRRRPGDARTSSSPTPSPSPTCAWPHQAIIRGDRSCLAVAAASIVAKVVRDAEMCRRQDLFPHLRPRPQQGLRHRRPRAGPLRRRADPPPPAQLRPHEVPPGPARPRLRRPPPTRRAMTASQADPRSRRRATRRAPSHGSGLDDRWNGTTVAAAARSTSSLATQRVRRLRRGAARASDAFGTPEELITPAKARRMVRCALDVHGRPSRPVR